MIDDFYRAFEEKYRGSRELILSRLAIYRPFILPLKAFCRTLSAIDLGCGRGEWLEFLRGEGFSPLGIDQDEGMLRDCQERNLPAQQGDAIAYLTTLMDESQSIISAFHVVEHISFHQLQTVVSESLRVLKPGGLLIIETPNPENIVVATRDFYLDPTHLRPIPPQLLSFLPEYYGFARTKILRLQESKDLKKNDSPTLNDVFDGVSPDYAVIAQKAAPAETLELFNEVFSQEYGISLNSLTERFDKRLKLAEEIAQLAQQNAQRVEDIALQGQQKAQRAEDIAQQAQQTAQRTEETAQLAEQTALQGQQKAQRAEDIAQQAQQTAQRAEETVQLAEQTALQGQEKAQRAEDIAQQAQQTAQLAQQKAQLAEEKALQGQEKAQRAEEIAQLAQQKAQRAEDIAFQAKTGLQAVYNSRSWRITAPLRWTGKVGRWFYHGSVAWITFAPMSRPRRVVRRSIISAKKFLHTHPYLKALVLRFLAPFPRLKTRFKMVGYQPPPVSHLSAMEGPDQLSPHARKIYNDLKATITKRQEE